MLLAARPAVILLCTLCLVIAMTAHAADVTIQPAEGGGFIARTPQYEARVAADGTLTSLRASGTELLGAPGAVFFSAGKFVRLQTARQEGADTIIAEGGPKDPAKSAASPCPLNGRITYKFLPDRIELKLEQSMDMYGGFAWVPSAAIAQSRDALTDCPITPGGPAQYQQTDPRWTTQAGAVLRFDFGVWQRGFANAGWGHAQEGGQTIPFMSSTVPASGPITAKVYPLSHPAAADAFTFDISATSPDFLMPGDRPVHFNIAVRNAGPEALAAKVRFEVRDYLTQKPVGGKATDVGLAAGASMDLPTGVPLTTPGPYRGALVIEQDGQPARSFWWVFTYDFRRYNPPTTRPPDFVQFWRQARAESDALPLDAKLTRVPEKDTATTEAFKINFATLGGRRIYGWYARPKAPGKYPAHLRFPSSGIYPLGGPEMFADRCSLWIQIHGFDVDLSNMPAGDDPGKGYWTAGIASPQTSMWRTIYMSLVRCVDFMLSQPEVDPAKVVVTGGSQGGGLAMAAASLDPRIKLCMPYHSGLPRLDWTVKHEPGYWPFGMNVKPEGQTEEQFLKTLSYFDPANLLPDVKCPVVAELGLMDTVTAAGNQICALAHVPRGQLFLVCSPWAMHGGGSRDSSLVAQCYDRFLKGEPAIAKPTR